MQTINYNNNNNNQSQYQNNNNQNYNNNNNNNYQIFDIESNQKAFEQQEKSNINSNLSGFNERKGFITKVYGILTSQILFTIFLCVLSIHYPNYLAWQLSNMWLFFVVMISLIIISIVIACSPKLMREVPTNYALLFSFTFCEGYMISVIAGLSNPQIVLIALVLTCGLFGALTAYALITQEDFTACGAFLSSVLCLLILMGIFLMFFNLPILNVIYSVLGVLVFSIYVIYDTQLLLENKKYSYTVDDYMVASIQLYIDFIQIFLYILSLLQNSQK